VTRTAGRSLAGLLAIVAAGTLLAVPCRAAAAATCATAGRTSAADTWPQKLLAPDRAWPFGRGVGQRVAILDSGVDASQPALAGRVERGFNAVTGHGRADSDCAGTGTQVAGAVAARSAAANGIDGVAPAATIVPVRVLGQPNRNDNGAVPPAVLARAIDWAVQQHVDVIDISPVVVKDDDRVRVAIAAAVAAGIIVVAAVGDLGSADDGNPTPYPAAYPGVIGVTAIDPVGAKWANAGYGSFVDLAAPGVAVAALQRVRGWVAVSGSTALAAGYVSGTAALVRQRWPNLSGNRIADRLCGTAAPAANGQGYGLVNPYAAVTDDLVYAPAAKPSALPATGPSAAELARRAARDHSRRVAIVFTITGLGVLLIVTLVAIGLPRARRRGWRPAYAAPLPADTEPDEPAPPVLLFEDAR
jgi:membrane-anchored mycosin MYCP